MPRAARTCTRRAGTRASACVANAAGLQSAIVQRTPEKPGAATYDRKVRTTRCAQSRVKDGAVHAQLIVSRFVFRNTNAAHDARDESMRSSCLARAQQSR